MWHIITLGDGEHSTYNKIAGWKSHPRYDKYSIKYVQDFFFVFVVVSPIFSCFFWSIHPYSSSWASCQIRNIVGCACAGDAGNVFPATDFKGNRLLAIPACITARAWRTCRDACRDRLPEVARGKRSRHSRRMRNPKFNVSGKRPIAWCDIAIPRRTTLLVSYIIGTTFRDYMVDPPSQRSRFPNSVFM